LDTSQCHIVVETSHDLPISSTNECLTKKTRSLVRSLVLVGFLRSKLRSCLDEKEQRDYKGVSSHGINLVSAGNLEHCYRVDVIGRRKLKVVPRPGSLATPIDP